MDFRKIVFGKMLLHGSGEERTAIKDGAVYIEGDQIIDVGKHDEISNNYCCDVEIGSNNHVLMPGFVNSHSHGRGFSPLRVGIRDAALEIWISYHLAEVFSFSIYHNALLSCMKLIESGVTTTNHHFYAHNPEERVLYERDLENVMKAYLDSGMRVSFVPAIQDQNHHVYLDERKFVEKLPKDIQRTLSIEVPGEEDISKRIKSYFDTFNEMFEKYQDYEGRIRLSYGPTGVHWCSDELLERVKMEAERKDVGIHIHLHETKYQRKYGFKVFGETPLQHLEEIDFLGSKVSLAHCVWLNEEDIELLSERRAVAVHNPSSNLRLFSGIAPIVQMIKKGVRVAIGLDSTGINDDEDILQEIRLCSAIHRKPGIKEYQGYSRHLTPAVLMDMATIKGAVSTGFNKIGAIEIGSKADLILLNTRNLPVYLIPMLSLEEIILNWAKGIDVDTVMINGEMIMRDRRFTKIDKNETLNILEKSIKEFDPKKNKALIKYRTHLKKYYQNWNGE
jgi:cytosine/adenosine deaminase-related metal-dependent hydrolase